MLRGQSKGRACADLTRLRVVVFVCRRGGAHPARHSAAHDPADCERGAVSIVRSYPRPCSALDLCTSHASSVAWRQLVLHDALARRALEGHRRSRCSAGSDGTRRTASHCESAAGRLPCRAAIFTNSLCPSRRPRQRPPCCAILDRGVLGRHVLHFEADTFSPFTRTLSVVRPWK